MTFWAIVVTPTGRHLHELGDEVTESALTTIRTQHSVPADWLERRLELGEQWHVQVAEGEPHPEQFWSKTEIEAARDALENEAGVPAKRERLRALRDMVEATGDALPSSVLDHMLSTIAELTQSIRVVTVEDVRDRLAKDLPPSRATVHRKPKPPKP